jgi:hypothetical protein
VTSDPDSGLRASDEAGCFHGSTDVGFIAERLWVDEEVGVFGVGRDSEVGLPTVQIDRLSPYENQRFEVRLERGQSVKQNAARPNIKGSASPGIFMCPHPFDQRLRFFR